MMGLQGFLKEVVNTKFEEVSASRSKISLSTVRSDAEQMPDTASFLSAMLKSCTTDIGIIAEIKKASPSKGDIRPDLDPAVFAQHYTQGGARAISVLTEKRFFKGTLADLVQVCQATDLPVLRKDFVISSYQIYEAARAGASSVLLITTILSPDQLKDYIQLAREIKLEPLVEITSEKEFEIAFNCGAKVLDINNRNLQTLETDLGVSRRIAAILPQDIIGVEASGISSFSDIEQGLDHGLSNFLVGESIVRSDDPAAFIQSLRNDE